MAENTANFLINAASLLPTECYANKLLKSYYLTKSRKLSQYDYQADNQKSQSMFSSENCCQKCSTAWHDGNFQMTIAPIKYSKRKSLRIRSKIDLDRKLHKKNPKMRAMSKRINNITTWTCQICGNRSKIAIFKKIQPEPKEEVKSESKLVQNIEAPEQTQTEHNIIGEPSNSDQPQIKKEKKKKKKINNAGLIIKTNENKTNPPRPKISPIVVPSPSNSQKKQIKSNNPTQNNANKNKAQKPSNQNHRTPTMKRNSLLQLASALKSKCKTTNSNDKLKLMFSGK